jgi:hypothetical protein
MSKVFNERHLRLEFAGGWMVEKYDDHVDYRDKIGRLQDTKAVDFVGVYQQEGFMIEVKDFRGHRIENKDRFGGPLEDEVAMKVRDTVAGIVGAIRTSANAAQWRPFFRCLSNANSCLRVILWLEDDAMRSDDAARARALVLTQSLKSRLRWLTTHVLAVSMRTHRNVPPDLRVTSLSGAAGNPRMAHNQRPPS